MLVAVVYSIHFRQHSVILEEQARRYSGRGRQQLVWNRVKKYKQVVCDTKSYICQMLNDFSVGFKLVHNHQWIQVKDLDDLLAWNCTVRMEHLTLIACLLLVCYFIGLYVGLLITGALCFRCAATAWPLTRDKLSRCWFIVIWYLTCQATAATGSDRSIVQSVITMQESSCRWLTLEKKIKVTCMPSFDRTTMQARFTSNQQSTETANL